MWYAVCMMNLPSSRKEAIAIRSPKYFTGIPCRNGHVAFRWTQSGSCEDCIHPKGLSLGARSPRGMVKVNIYCEIAEFATVADGVLEVNRMREPRLQVAHITTDEVMGNPGHPRAIYTFRTFPEYKQMLQDLFSVR